jgi:hypothetical protein
MPNEPKKRTRKPTISKKELEAAKAAGATSLVIEKNGCRIEVRFGEPGQATSEWDAEIEKLNKQLSKPK